MKTEGNTYKKFSFEETLKNNHIMKDDFPIVISETYGIDKSSVMLHYHEYIEICFIKQGTGTYFIDGSEYSFKAGDIFIIGSNEIHLAYNDKDVVVQVVLFMPDLLWSGVGYAFEMEGIQIYWELGKMSYHRIEQGNKHYDILVNTLFEIFRENQGKTLGHKLIIKALLLKITAVIHRCFELERNSETRNMIKNYKLFLPVFEYIKSNYHTKIKLEELASLVNMSSSNFNLVFKRYLGSTPMEYINKIRIVQASKMLLETEKKIIDIAGDCGFFSLPHFISCFKKYTGKLPKDFRK